MFVKSYSLACKQAQANADLNQEDWSVFSDTSNNWHCEKRDLSRVPTHDYEVFRPRKKMQNRIMVTSNEQHCVGEFIVYIGPVYSHSRNIYRGSLKNCQKIKSAYLATGEYFDDSEDAYRSSDQDEVDLSAL